MKRYNLIIAEGPFCGFSASMGERINGPYVKYDEAAAIERENEALRNRCLDLQRGINEEKDALRAELDAARAEIKRLTELVEFKE